MLVEVDTLTGQALVAAAMLAMGETPQVVSGKVFFRSEQGSWCGMRVSDEEAAKLIGMHWIGLDRPSKGQSPPQWHAMADFQGRSGGAGEMSHLVVSSWSTDMPSAVFRAFVKSRFGEKVDVPDELLSTISARAGAAASNG